MKKKSFKSLSTKIVFSIALISLLAIIAIFTAFERVNKKAFYNIEMEKANLITRTIEPLIALNIYLGMTSKIDHIIEQLIENQNILAVQILKNSKIINEVKSNEYDKGIRDSYLVKLLIFFV